MMCCCQSQIASDYMKFSFNPLCLVYVPAPPPPPPPASSASSFSYPVAYHYPVSTLTRGIQGCPKTISLDKNIWHSTLEKSFQSSFFPPLCVRTFLQHPLPKNALLFPPLNNPRIFSRFFSCYSFFHPCLTNANYLCRRIFWNLPA